MTYKVTSPADRKHPFDAYELIYSTDETGDMWLMPESRTCGGTWNNITRLGDTECWQAWLIEWARIGATVEVIG